MSKLWRTGITEKEGNIEILETAWTTGLWVGPQKVFRNIRHLDFAEILVYENDGANHAILYRDFSDLLDIIVYNDCLYFCRCHLFGFERIPS